MFEYYNIYSYNHAKNADLEQKLTLLLISEGFLEEVLAFYHFSV